MTISYLNRVLSIAVVRDSRSYLINVRALGGLLPGYVTQADFAIHIAGTMRVLFLSGSLQRAVFWLRRCSLALIISLRSAAGRISKMLPYVSAGCCAMSCTA